MTVIEKVAYLKGLADGLSLSDTTAEGKVLLNVVDILQDMAMSITDLEDAVEELGETVDAIDEDLEDVEDIVYEEDDEDEYYDDDDDYDEFDDEDEALYEVVCPTCGDTICLDESMLCEGEINCPNCHEKLEFDLDDLDCKDNCEGCSGCDFD